MQNEYKKALYFFEGEKEEIVLFFGEEYHLSPGEITKTFLEVDKAFWNKVEEIARTLREDCEKELQIGLKSSSEISYDLPSDIREKCERDYADGLIRLIKLAKTILNLAAPLLLKKLLLLLPAYQFYAAALRNLDQAFLATTNYEENMRNMRDPKRTPQEHAKDTELFYNNRNALEEFPAVQNRWRRLIDALLNDFADENYEASEENDKVRKNQNEAVFVYALNTFSDRKEMLGVMKEYSRNMHYICAVARKLRVIVPVVAGITNVQDKVKTQADAEFRYYAERPVLLWKEDACELFAEYNWSKDNRGFLATTLSTLILLELDLCSRNRFRLRRCVLCKRLFVTRNSKVKYCKSPNPSYNGRPCQEVAPQIVFREKQKSNPVEDKYSTKHATYQQWMRRKSPENKENKQDTMVELQQSLIPIYGEEIVCHLISKVEREIQSIYNAWNENAIEKKIEYEAGSITEKEALDALELPITKARSPILAYIKEADFYIDEDYLKELGIIK